MITYSEKKWIGKRRNDDKTARLYVEGTCLSTDSKPLDVDNGSKLMEIDTATLYVFDLENMVWRSWT